MGNCNMAAFNSGSSKISTGVRLTGSKEPDFAVIESRPIKRFRGLFAFLAVDLTEVMCRRDS